MSRMRHRIRSAPGLPPAWLRTPPCRRDKERLPLPREAGRARVHRAPASTSAARCAAARWELRRSRATPGCCTPARVATFHALARAGAEAACRGEIERRMAARGVEQPVGAVGNVFVHRGSVRGHDTVPGRHRFQHADADALAQPRREEHVAGAQRGRIGAAVESQPGAPGALCSAARYPDVRCVAGVLPVVHHELSQLGVPRQTKTSAAKSRACGTQRRPRSVSKP